MPSAQRIIECRCHAFPAGSGARRDSLIRCLFVDTIPLTIRTVTNHKSLTIAVKPMSLKTRVIGLNRLLTAVYGSDMRLSILLSNLGFDSQQIAALRNQHLERIMTDYIDVIRERLLSKPDGDRLYTVIIRRYGLDGNPPDTLQRLGEQFGVSRERVRQLEKKALRRCKHKTNVRYWETQLREVAKQQLG